mmetsp:Transcript_14516/g.22708  ORF Transcript_14516/g.22708 Transcript_14516/m.22708 type:complete len:292 (+) Transcript_14516:86-961(+)|eukprot:CAMPEP_0195298072 /NCGR_PEP_ID=MMETSP0707-20130614/22718_1 /TAXON_ID=33640 /ORGANISM="Asterionellopsis glacialis, Strain CCMP134" /LENGTH=291 /DNA_ID=CAMNT_0040360061 /DNA_START=54 /DNA_END=929 /DNA_ORIENTATION=+
MPGFADYLKTSKRHSKSSFVQSSSATRKPTSSSEAVDGQKLRKKKKKKKRSSSINASMSTGMSAPPQRRLSLTPSNTRPTKARGLKMKLSMIKEASKEDLMESFRNYSKSFKKSVRNFTFSSRKLSIPEDHSTASFNKKMNTREKDEIVPSLSGEIIGLPEPGKTETGDEIKRKIVFLDVTDEIDVTENTEKKKIADSVTTAINALTVQETDPAPKCEEQDSQVSSKSKKSKSTKSKFSSANKNNSKKEDAFASWAKQMPQKPAATRSTGVKRNAHRSTHQKDAFAAWAKK